MYICSCFGITEEQVREHAAAGSCTPRQIASASGAGTDCGSCVRRIQGLLGRTGCPAASTLRRPLPTQAPTPSQTPVPAMALAPQAAAG